MYKCIYNSTDTFVFPAQEAIENGTDVSLESERGNLLRPREIRGLAPLNIPTLH